MTTRGHPDHVGSGDLADESDVPAEHYVAAPDLDRMRHRASYRVRSFDRIAGLAPLPAPPSARAALMAAHPPLAALRRAP